MIKKLLIFEVVYLASWDFELDFRVRFSSWIFELDFRIRVFFAGFFQAGFPINFQCFFYTTFFVVVLRCFRDGGERGWIGKGNILFNLVFWTGNNSWHLNECF